MPQEFPARSEFIRTEIAYLFAQFLLLIEAMQFLEQKAAPALT